MPVRPVTRNESQTAPLKDKSTTDFKNVSAEQTPGPAAGTPPGQDKAASQPGDQAGQPTGRATTLLNDDGSAHNCLEEAAGQAKAGQDVVFLDNAAPKASGAGHAVIEDRKTGQVIDPEALGGKRTYASLGDYLQAAKAGGRDFSVAGYASGEEVRAVLAKPQGERAAFIARTDPSLGAVEDHPYAIGIPSPVLPKKPPDPGEGAVPSDVPLVANDKNPADGTILKGLMNVAHDWKELGLGKTFKPSDDPKDDHARDELAFIRNNPTLSKVLGGDDGAISKKDVEGLIKKDQNNAKDLQETESNDPLKDLTGLDDQQAKDIRRPLQEAKLLASHWDDWGFAGGQSLSPDMMPNNLSDAEASALRDVETGALGKAIMADHNTGKLNDDTTVTKKDVLHFIDKLDGAAKSAKSSFDAFIKDNKTPDPIAKQTAIDGLILQANAPILDAAAKDANLDDKFNMDDLKAIATDPDNKGLPDALKSAAGLYADQGHFTGLSNAGLDPSQTSDGTANNADLTALLSKNTSKSEDDSISALRSAATQQAISDAGGDGSKVGADYFTSGKTDASGADKAAALFQLSEAVRRYKSGESAFNPSTDFNPATYTGEGPSPGQQRDDFVKDVQGRIDKLSADKDVQQFVADKVPGTLQGIVGSDPALKAAVQTRLDETSGSKALEDAFGQKGADDKPLSTTDALGAFIAKPTFYAQALATTPDLTKALDGASTDIKDKVKAGYDDITSGKDFANLTAQGVPDDKAVIQTTTNKALYDSVLGEETVADGTNKFDDAVTKVGREKLTDGLTMDDIYKGLGVSGANDPKLQEFINNNLVTIVGPTKGDGPTASDILSGVRSMDDAIRGSAKFDDSYVKLQKALGNNDAKSGLPTNVTDTYKAGYMHGVSSILLLGAIGARAATGNQGDKLATAAQSLSAAGLMTEGGSKYYQTKLAEINKTPGAISKSDLANWTNAAKDVENVGKSIGGVAGNVLGAVVGGLSAKKSADSGDTGGAAAQGVFAGLNGISAIAGGAEVAAYVVPRVFSSVAASSTAAFGALAGTIGGVIGGAAAVGGLIYAIVKDIQQTDKINKQRDKWYDTITDEFKPFGVTVPDAGILASDPNADPNAPPFLPPIIP